MTPSLPRFELLLFHHKMDLSRDCVDAGIDGLMIDLERKGKSLRQNGFDTQISQHALSDLRAVARAFRAPIICRIDGPCRSTAHQIEQVLDAGAQEIVVPMIQTLPEAEFVVHRVNGRAKVALMIETVPATKLVAELSSLPINRIYVGLNDLNISRGTPHIFMPMIDGLLADIRASAGPVKFGFGGLTLPHLGYPLPAKHLFTEMARLRCEFTFLRRSFYRDLSAVGPSGALGQLRDTIDRARQRSEEQVNQDHCQMREAVLNLDQVACA